MNGLGDTVDGAGDRDRTGMASLEGSVTPAMNALVRALLRWTSCLPRALRAIQWTNFSTGVAGPTVHCTPIAPADEEGASICLPARLGVLTGSVGRVGGRGGVWFVRRCHSVRRRELHKVMPSPAEGSPRSALLHTEPFREGTGVFEGLRDEVPSPAVLVDQVAAEQP